MAASPPNAFPAPNPLSVVAATFPSPTRGRVVSRGTPSAPSRKAAPKAAKERAVTLGAPMRWRARVLLGLAFLIALPALFVGVVRASNAAETTDTMVAAQGVADAMLQLELELAQARTTLWHLEAEPGADVVRRVRVALDTVSRSALLAEVKLRGALADPVLNERVRRWSDPGDGAVLLPAKNPLGRIGGAIGRLRGEVDPILVRAPKPGGKVEPPNAASLRRARAALDSATRDVLRVRTHATEVTAQQVAVATGALSNAGRDQLVLFLIVLLACPVLVGFGPGFILAPVSRLRAAVLKIKSGRVRELRAVGDDEIAGLTDTLAKALSSLSTRDHMKTAKIFEMRKLLREVLHLVDEPVLVIGRHDAVDYANDAAAVLFGDECHHLEKKPLEEICFAPVLAAALARARLGESNDEGVDVTLEGADGRVQQRRVVAGPIVGTDGRVERVVLVFH